MNAEDLSISLCQAWLSHGPPEGFEKNAAVEYFYDLQKEHLDREVLGENFCKLASAFDQDPWLLADDIVDNFEVFQVLTKTAAGTPTSELAQFYMDWAEEMEKRAVLGRLAAWAGKGIGRMFGKGVARAGGKMTQAARTATVGTPTQVARQTGRALPKAQRKAMSQQYYAQRATRAQKAARGKPVQTSAPASQAELKAQLQAKQVARRGGKGVTTPTLKQPGYVQPRSVPGAVAPTSAQAKATAEAARAAAAPRGAGATMGQKLIGYGLLGGLGAGGLAYTMRPQEQQAPQGYGRY